MRPLPLILAAALVAACRRPPSLESDAGGAAGSGSADRQATLAAARGKGGELVLSSDIVRLVEDRGDVLVVELATKAMAALVLEPDDRPESVALAVTKAVVPSAPSFRSVDLLGGESFLVDTKTQARLFPVGAKVTVHRAVLVVDVAPATLVPVEQGLATDADRAFATLVTRYLVGRAETPLAKNPAGRDFDPPRRDAFTHLERRAAHPTWRWLSTPKGRTNAALVAALVRLDDASLDHLVDAHGRPVAVDAARKRTLLERKRDLLDLLSP